ncbi:hypothetical protein CTAM01_09944 [Colletotrichum tamarilloi]|uniref:Uncharacterized protein n=1 Tax=Colletotrichum tamarilloi TaxID=1209934 RepID=A0ABQ9R217_9PEZI|nr:uncharacterized protein CTAM01_09944 [Colletotrichum tamarilloi]KAK1492527.1 hypothetical protein CTAM01_09944 [Colletotrichum tamarilloi]
MCRLTLHGKDNHQPSSIVPVRDCTHHIPFNPRHAGASPRRPQLYGCPLHLSLKPFRIDNRDPGTWIKTAVCGVQSHAPRLSLVSSPLPLPSLLTSPRCASTVYVHLHCVLSTKLPNVPPSKHLGLFQEHQWESKLGASYPRHSLPSNLGTHRTAPHRTALHHLLTRWQPGPHAERHLRYTCLKVLSLTPHCTARYATCVRTCTNIGKVTTPRHRDSRRDSGRWTQRGASGRAAANFSASVRRPRGSSELDI